MVMAYELGWRARVCLILAVVILPKLLFGHCIFHLLGFNYVMGYDPLHILKIAAIDGLAGLAQA